MCLNFGIVGGWKWEVEDEEAGGTKQKHRNSSVRDANKSKCDVIRMISLIECGIICDFLCIFTDWGLGNNVLPKVCNCRHLNSENSKAPVIVLWDMLAHSLHSNWILGKVFPN